MVKTKCPLLFKLSENTFQWEEINFNGGHLIPQNDPETLKSCFPQLRPPPRLLEPGGSLERPHRVRGPGLLPAQLQSGRAPGGGHPGDGGGNLPVSGGLQGTPGEED